MTEKTAIIDIGSNTIRLVIYESTAIGTVKELENVKAVARLRSYLTEEGILSEEGIQVLLSILHSFNKVVDFHHVKEIRSVATATIRQALNQSDIISRVYKETNLSISILSEEEEAYYGYFAAVNTTSVSTGFSIDIGGGSTEITYFEDKQIKHSHSFPFGVVSLKEQFIQGDSLQLEEREVLVQFIIEQFLTLPWLKEKNAPIIAIGGSARNVAQIDQSQNSYPIAGVHQYVMSPESISRMRDVLLPLDYVELEKIEGLSKDRADIILPALEVFYQLILYTGAPSFIFSRNGLRDGLILEQTEGKKVFSNQEIVERSLRQLGFEYNVNYSHNEQMLFLIRKLWEGFGQLGLWSLNEESLRVLEQAAFLFYLGEYIDSDSSSQHTFYILANKNINGIPHKERVAIALLASFKNKSSLKQYMEPFLHWFSKDEVKLLKEFGPLLKMAYSLNATKRNVVHDVSITEKQGNIVVCIICEDDILAEQYQFEKQKKHLEKALKREIVLEVLRN
ncbi:hypothetical protein Q75_05150 [Bacillus coahuilensis p1.1.43]|uniref:Uncharacterized protein n=1 Tax=Bacillus coahuilensis p1.1.43 TaxID=1150625 RepID=A0A147KA80_9BACI|nr:Ppx/GppA family phosphatase [Bacillus coahuilensis]KUP07615.1 hypothetical protein Q75_05150 [Bacillus coahuilensis p1.1.43]